MDGEIRDGQIWNGRHYIYDDYGLLDHIEVYKEGKYVGNGVIGKSEFIKKDTINQKDKDGKKTGYWRITPEIRKYYKDQGYADSSIVEEGYYLNNRKTGLWKFYYPNGILKKEIEYENGRPYGDYSTYYASGLIEEKGTMIRLEMRNKFWRYFPSGCLQQFTFFDADSTYSEYYFDDCNSINSEKGELEIAFSSFSGYDESTSVKEEVIYYRTKRKTTNRWLIIPYGHKTYNADKDILLDGEFKNGHLYNGKYYIYDEFGLLERIEVYKEGKYVGNEVLSD